jgi:segregation and condensation protein B
METLAIIAYKQPITKSEIESIRGVSADYSIQKLLEKELIIISGRNEDMPGKPLVYITSRSFMDYFGLNGPEDLPRIREVLAEQAVEPTQMVNQQVHVANGDDQLVSDTLVMEDPNSVLLVNETGELLEASFTEETQTATESELTITPDMEHLPGEAMPDQDTPDAEFPSGTEEQKD